MHTVVETRVFTQQAADIFSPAEKALVIDRLARDPLAGDEIVGTGGVRKMRVAAQGRGKSGGARVIYFWYGPEAPVYALLAYPKSRKADLTGDERNAVAALAAAIKAAHRR